MVSMASILYPELINGAIMPFGVSSKHCKKYYFSKKTGCVKYTEEGTMKAVAHLIIIIDYRRQLLVGQKILQQKQKLN